MNGDTPNQSLAPGSGATSRIMSARSTTGWIFQRVGWSAAVCVLAASIAGVFGDGPLSRCEETSGDGAISVRYERFVRLNSPARIRIFVRPDQSRPAEMTSLWIERQYLDDMKLVRVMPEPVRSEVSASKITMVFAATGESATLIEVSMWFTTEGVGRLSGRVGHGVEEDGRSEIELTQWSYP